MRNPLLIAAAAALLAFVISGCAERSQTVAYVHGKYQGKTDSQPWNSQPPSYVRGGWVRGDEASWVQHMRTRNQNQDEYELMDR